MIKIKKHFFAGNRSGNGKFVFLSGEKTACLFDADKKKIVNTFPYSADAVSFDEKNSFMYAIEMNGKLHIYDLLKDKEIFSKQLIKKKSEFCFESGIGAIGDNIYFIGADESGEKSIYYCFRYNSANDELRKTEVETGSIVMGTGAGNIVCSYTGDSGEICFKSLDSDLRIKDCFFREHIASDQIFYNETFYYVAYEGNVAYFVEEKGEKILRKEEIADVFSDILLNYPRRSFDADGRYIAIVYYDKGEREYKFLCYDIQGKKIVANEIVEDVGRISIMKNGFFYGGEVCYFKEFQEFL